MQGVFLPLSKEGYCHDISLVTDFTRHHPLKIQNTPQILKTRSIPDGTPSICNMFLYKRVY